MNLYKWEMRQNFRSKIFWFIGGAFLLFTCLFHLDNIIHGGIGGYELFLTLCSNFNSLALFFIGIFAGLHITGAFEDRRMQAAVMAGNSRMKVLFTKFASFVTAIAIFFTASVIVPSIAGFIRFGTACEDGSFLRNVIARAPLFLFTQIAACAVCFIISTLCKKQGIAVIINMVTLMALNIGSQFIAFTDWGETVVQFLPQGQSIIVIGDMSNGSIAFAFSVCALFVLLFFTGSYAKVSKEELK